MSFLNFFSHWRLYTDEDLPPTDPRELVLGPEVIRPRGRPSGAINRPTISEQGQPAEDRSTRRAPSAFEHVLSRESRRGRGHGRGRGRGERQRGYRNRGGGHQDYAIQPRRSQRYGRGQPAP